MDSIDRINELKTLRAKSYQRLLTSHSLWDRADRLAKSLLKRYTEDKLEWESTDHKLALLDGRLTIEPSAKARNYKEKKQKIEVELTLEQIDQLLARLGMTVPEVTMVESEEDLVGLELPDCE
jgi:hypothetical protein